MASEYKQIIDETMKYLQELKDYKKWYDSLLGESATDDDISKLYESKIVITVADKSIAIPFDAEVYNNIEHVLQRVIEEF